MAGEKTRRQTIKERKRKVRKNKKEKFKYLHEGLLKARNSKIK